MYIGNLKKTIFVRMKLSSVKIPGFDFIAALLIGILILWLMQRYFKPTVLRNTTDFPVIFFLKITVLFPYFEEYLFRGVLQATIVKKDFGRKSLCGISSANLMTSLLFTAAHFFYHPPLWAASVFFPSLLFGYFRDSYGNTFYSTLLHIFYNTGYYWYFIAGL